MLVGVGMETGKMSGSFARLVALCAIAASLSASGCLAVIAGGTAGLAGAAAYEYWKGAVRETIPADTSAVWQAAHASLADLGLPVIFSGNEGKTLLIESRSPRDEVIKIEIEPEKSSVPQAVPKSEISIRVGTWGDEYLSRRILEQIYVRLGHSAAPVQSAASR